MPNDESPVNMNPETLTLASGATLAYHRTPARGGDALPGVVFLGGFMSDMTGTKAVTLEQHARDRGQAFLRFDYQGHGQSSGRFDEGTIGLWAADALAAFDNLTEGPQILIGSSMGGWISLLLALARPQRLTGLIGIAAAPDFTERMWEDFSPEIRRRLEREGVHHMPSDYGDEPYTITHALIEDGRANCLLGGPIGISCPVRLLQGMADAAVPWRTALEIAERLVSDDVEVTLVKAGDHRLSEDADLARLLRTVDELSEKAAGTR